MSWLELFDMQDFFAILIVAFAAAFLARRAWRHLAGRVSHACGACAGCNADAKNQLVTTISNVAARIESDR